MSRNKEHRPNVAAAECDPPLSQGEPPGTPGSMRHPNGSGSLWTFAPGVASQCVQLAGKTSELYTQGAAS